MPWQSLLGRRERAPNEDRLKDELVYRMFTCDFSQGFVISPFTASHTTAPVLKEVMLALLAVEGKKSTSSPWNSTERGRSRTPKGARAAAGFRSSAVSGSIRQGAFPHHLDKKLAGTVSVSHTPLTDKKNL
jgi:hypothetical protein